MYALHRVFAKMVVLLVVAVFAACADDAHGPGEVPVPVAAVEVLPQAAALDVGETLPLGATARSTDGTALENRSVSWSSSDTRVATVTQEGVVGAAGAGVAKVRARVEGRWAEATITVAEPEPVRPVLSTLTPAAVEAGSPGATIVLEGSGFEAGAVVLWSGVARAAQRISATELRVTAGASELETERTVQIAVRNPGGAVDSDPLLFRVTPGSQVPVEWVIVDPGSAALLVDGTVSLMAVTLSASGGVLTGRAIAWSSENPEVATVDAEGIVTGVGKGTTRIRAESEGKVGWGSVEVRQYSSGPVQTYALLGVLGTPFMPVVGATTWVDEHGTSHDATLLLHGGELTRDTRNGRYTQTLIVNVMVQGRGAVAQVDWTDQGSWGYNVPNGLWFASSSTGATFTAVSGEAGELVVEQAIGTAPMLVYRWVIE
jgi:hypothetical protein